VAANRSHAFQQPDGNTVATHRCIRAVNLSVSIG
jgi:hypothetical protein